MNKLLWLKCCGSLCCSSSIVAMHATAVLRSCHNPVESFQQLLAEGRLIDVRIRCIFLDFLLLVGATLSQQCHNIRLSLQTVVFVYMGSMGVHEVL